jgi:excisionase family DNA binding protein
MPKKIEYVSAVEAARLTGLSEKTIRRKIDAGALKAEKHGTSYAIRVTDLQKLTGQRPTLDTLDAVIERVQELEEIQASQAETINTQAEQISRLEQRITELEQRPAAPAPARTRPLTGQIPPRPVHLAAIRSQAPSDQAEQQPEEDEGRTPTQPLAAPANMPPGSVLMARFAEQYNIAARTLNDHARKGLISVTVIDRGGRPQYWLTPEQQQAILDQRGL